MEFEAEQRSPWNQYIEKDDSTQSVRKPQCLQLTTVMHISKSAPHVHKGKKNKNDADRT